MSRGLGTRQRAIVEHLLEHRHQPGAFGWYSVSTIAEAVAGCVTPATVESTRRAVQTLMRRPIPGTPYRHLDVIKLYEPSPGLVYEWGAAESSPWRPEMRLLHLDDYPRPAKISHHDGYIVEIRISDPDIFSAGIQQLEESWTERTLPPLEGLAVAGRLQPRAGTLCARYVVLQNDVPEWLLGRINDEDWVADIQVVAGTGLMLPDVNQAASSLYGAQVIWLTEADMPPWGIRPVMRRRRRGETKCPIPEVFVPGYWGYPLDPEGYPLHPTCPY